MTETVKVTYANLLPLSVDRKLGEGEEVCDKCSGTALVTKKKPEGTFLVGCRECNGRGVLKHCEHCGELKRNSLYDRHDCESMRLKRDLEVERKEQEKWDVAKKISLADACKVYDLVVVGWDTYMSPDDVIDHILDNRDEDNPIPRVWGTATTTISVDYERVLEDATEELHEEAYGNIGKTDRDDLKEFLHGWAGRETVRNATLTYFPDEKVGIEITEADLEESR